jgi:hypothetical protein
MATLDRLGQLDLIVVGALDSDGQRGALPRLPGWVLEGARARRGTPSAINEMGSYRKGGGDMAARRPVADRTIQCQARSGPLIAGGGGRLAPGRDIPAQCFRAPT